MECETYMNYEYLSNIPPHSLWLICGVWHIFHLSIFDYINNTEVWRTTSNAH